jgi:hypothetical protein
MGHALLPFASEMTRLVWEGTFGNAALRAHAAGRLGRPSPVPVTVQTPGPPAPMAAPTVAMANTGPPTPAGPAVRPQPTIAIRPRFRAGFWVLGVVLLLCGGGAMVLMVSEGGAGAGQRPGPAAPATQSPAPVPAAILPVVVAAPGPERAAAAIETPAEPSGGRPPAAELRARPGKKPRFGANRAPIIE